MYSVSDAYIEQMMKKATRRRLTGTIGSVAFTGDDIVRGSFEVSGRATTASDTKIGGVYLGELSLMFVPSFLAKVARNTYRDKEISVAIGLWIPDDEDLIDGGEWVDVPIGVYTAQAPKISKRGVEVTAYDHMARLDKRFNLDATYGTPYGYLSYIASHCNVELGNTEAEIQALPNGTETLPMYQENDIETCRDLLYWVAQACGCFACADREGRIVLRQFGTVTGVEFDEDHRDADVIFSGYVTKWTGVSFVDLDTQMTRYYGLEVDDGLTMNMGANPLLQLGSATAVERRRRAVLGAVAQIQYTPFYANSARDPIFDLGDEIPFSGGISGECTGCVMSYDYSIDNFTFEGYGDDPALANARSKADKNIAGLLQSTTENEVTFYQYANTEAITFGSEQEVSIASLRFMSAQETTVKIMHEFLIDFVSDLALDGSYELRYYLDEELLSYKPYERLGAVSGLTTGNVTDVSIARDFFYLLKNVEPGSNHTWEVRIIAHNIQSAVIQQDHAHVVIEGQRLYGEEFYGGLIEARDYLTIIPYGYLSLVSITDAADVTPSTKWWHGDDVGGSDEVSKYAINEITMLPIVDDFPTIVMKRGFPWRLENDDTWVTESGDRWFTE